MKRDDWKLGSGIKAGDLAILDDAIRCKVLKVTGKTIKGFESGNVLIELPNGEQIAVIGSRLKNE